MRKRISILALCLFVLGMVVVPAAHMASLASGHDHSRCHGQSEPQKHGADHCSICQLAHTPLTVTVPVVVPVAVAVIVESLPLPAALTICRAEHALPFSCGPPA